LIDIKLKEFEEKNKKNIVQYYFDMWCDKNIQIFAIYEEELKEKYGNSFEPKFELKNVIGTLNIDSFDNNSPYKYRFFTYKMNLINKKRWINTGHMLQSYFGIIMQNFMRDIENILREESGLPRIGEGWISETKMFKLIEDAFPDETVIHHGKPKWLGQQHLDVYFPDLNIALEYQGKQHDEPVEYFGGNEAYLNQQKRDKKKKAKCDKNNCKLIYVRDGYNDNELISLIKDIIKKK